MLTGKMRWSLHTFIMSVGGVSFALASVRKDLIWISLSIIYLFLMYAVLNLDIKDFKSTTLRSFKRKLILVSSLPLMIGSIGFLNEGFFLLEGLSFVALNSVFAISILLILENRTEVRSKIQFSNLFLYLFPIGVGAFRGIMLFLHGQIYGNEYFTGNDHFMLELLIITIFSFYIGSVFKYHLKRSEYLALLGMEDEMSFSGLEHQKEDFLDFLNSIFSRFERSTMISISTVFQWGIYGVIIYGLIVDNHPVTVWAVFSFGISVIPEIISRNSKNNFPAILYFWSTLVLFIFAVGRPLGFYSLSRWWAEITHLLSGSAVALLLFSFLMYIDDRSENLSLPNWLIPLLVILFILPIGVFWEIAEFYVDLIFDSSVQPNLEDTGYDLIFNLIGAILSLLMISFFTTVDFFSYYRKNLLKILRSRS